MGDEASSARFELDSQGRVVAIHGVSRSILGDKDDVAEEMVQFLQRINYVDPIVDSVWRYPLALTKKRGSSFAGISSNCPASSAVRLCPA